MRLTTKYHLGFNPESRYKKQTKEIFFLCFLWIPVFTGMTLWLTLPRATAAVGISVAPPSLELKGSRNKKITGSFTVTNPSRETVIYEVTNDGLLSLMITPTSFLLEPNKKAKVTVEYASQKLNTHYYQLTTHLSVLGRSLTVNPTQAATGIKLPVIITVGHVAGASTWRFDPLIIGILAADACLVLWLGLMLFRHRSARRRNPVSPLPRP